MEIAMVSLMDWPTYWSKNMIHVRDLKVHQDDRGYLFEMIHDYELPKPADGLLRQYYEAKLVPPPGRFGQVYVVGNPARGAIRAFHKHYSLWDYFCIISGTAKFLFVDDRGDGIKEYSYKAKPGATKEVVVSGDRPQMIAVPPGVFHGWKSLTDNTVLLSVGSEVYNPSNPDEVRVPPNSFRAEFGGFDPWEVRGR